MLQKQIEKKNYYRRHRHDSMQISIIVPVIVSCPTARNAVSKLIHVIEFLFLQVSCNRPFSICMQSLFSFADPHKLNVFKSKSKKNQFHLINGSYVWRGESWDFFSFILINCYFLRCIHERMEFKIDFICFVWHLREFEHSQFTSKSLRKNRKISPPKMNDK